MQQIVLLRRPRLPARMIRTTGAEVVPHELHHLLALFDARERQRLLLSHSLNFVPRELVVSIQISASKQENIAKLDLSALIRSDLFQRLDTNRARLKSVVRDVVLHPPCMIVQQYSSPYNSLLRPRTDSNPIRLLHAIPAMNLIKRHAVVKLRLLLIPKVPQTVPLRAGLGVEGPDVVVDDSGWFLVDILLEGLAPEEREVGLGVQGPVEVDSGAGLDFAGRGGFDGVVCEAVQGAELVVFAVAVAEVEVSAEAFRSRR